MLHTRKKWVCLVAVTFFLQLGIAFYCSHILFSNYPAVQLGVIAAESGDTFSYLGAIDNLIESGDYFFLIGDHLKIYAGRMPYYGVIYFLLRQFFEKSVAYDVYVILQILINALATVVFAQLCFEVCRKKSSFWIGFTARFCCINFILVSFQLNTESLSLSLITFFAYFVHRFWSQQKWSSAIWASIFLALLTVLKPYFILVYPVFVLSVWLTLKRNSKERVGWANFVSNIYRTLLLGLPLIILLTPWTVRNFVLLGKFIPFQSDIYAGYNYGKAHLAFVDFVSSWGGGSVFWEADEAGCYFLIRVGQPCEYSLPDYALADGYTREDIERVRQNFFNLQKNYSPELDESVAAEFEHLTDIYRQERPFMYHIGARLLYFEKLFLNFYNYNFPFFKSSGYHWIFQNLFKSIQTVIHFSLLILGAYGLLNLAFKRKISLTFILIPLIIAILFIELRTTERRYVEHIYPFLLIGVTALLTTIGEWLKTFWNNNLFSRKLVS